MSIGSTPPRGQGPLNPTEGTPTKGLSAGQKAGAATLGTLSTGSIVAGALVVAGIIGLSVVTAGIPLIAAGVVGLAVSLFGAKKLADRKIAQAELPKPSQAEMTKTTQAETGKAGQSPQTYTDALSRVKENITFVATQKGSKVGTDICRASEISKFVAHECRAPFTTLIQALNTPNANLPEAFNSAAKDIPDDVCKLFAECEKHIDSELVTHGRIDERAGFMKGLRANGIGHSMAPVLGNMLKDLQDRKESVTAQMKLGMVQQAIVAGTNNESATSPWHQFLEDILVRGRTLIRSENSPVDNIRQADFKGDPETVRDAQPDSPTAFHAAPNTDNMSASHFSSSVATPGTQRPVTPENDSKDNKVAIHAAPKTVEKTPPGPHDVALSAAKKSITNAVYLGSEVLSGSEISGYVSTACSSQFDEIADLMPRKNSVSLPETFATIANKFPADVCKLFAECEKHIDDQLDAASRSHDKSAFLRGLLVNGLAAPLLTYLSDKEEAATEREDYSGAAVFADARRDVDFGVRGIGLNSPWDGLLENILARGRQELGS